MIAPRRFFPINEASLACVVVLLCGALHQLYARETVNDVTMLNPIVVAKVEIPTTLGEIVSAIKRTPGPISIGGSRHSQGGQISEENSLHLDMRKFNRVVAFDPKGKTITVESGITWRDIQELIDPYNLSVMIMQTYSNFTVGGSLSVNCHGRYVGAGPIILSVRRIQIVLPDGSVVEASPQKNSNIFDGALGVITEATLQLVDNTKIQRVADTVPISHYKNYFFEKIRNSPPAVFHNGDLYPPFYNTVRAVTWNVTDKPVTVLQRLIGRHEDYSVHQRMIWFVSESPFGKLFREFIADPLIYLGHPIVWRNHEASYDAAELEPVSRTKSTYVLQEYFVPVNQFDAFYPKLVAILKQHHVNVMNISIRHARQDPGSLLAWTKTEVFAFVLYYKQGTASRDKTAVGLWTQELIDAALSVHGSYYLPYQIHATDEQFERAYPQFQKFFALKASVDPENKFRNKLWDAYYPKSSPHNKTDQVQ